MTGKDSKHMDMVQDANVRGSLDIQIYRHCEIATDWSVHVRYTRDVTESGRQTLGSTIIASLEALGSVYASTWERIEVRD
jgi:hypothetical protein